MGFLAHHILDDTARRRPDHTALIAGGQRYSFAALARASSAVAGALATAGVRRGDRVAVMLENSADYVIALFAIWKAGAVYVPVPPTTKPDKLAFILNDCGVSALFAPPGLVTEGAGGVPVLSVAGAAAASPLAVEADGVIDQDLAAILYTSGTTGRPKGVMLTHANLCAVTRSIAQYLENTPDDVVLSVLPLTFGYGLSQVMTGALVGFTLVLERSFAFPADTLKRMVEHRVTGLPGVPTVFSTLLQMPSVKTADLSCLRYLTNAAAPLPAAHLGRIAALFPQARFFSMYGLTECSTRVCFLDPAHLPARMGSVGRPIPNCDAYVADAAGNRLPPGEVGELVVRGANVMRGYWNLPEETARRLRPGPDGTVLLRTGDLFTADADGFLTFVARMDDVFKCRGEKVSPKEVESVLCELDGVLEAAVTGVPDPVDGMAVKAIVVPRPDAVLSEAHIRQHCRARLEAHLVPRHVEFRAELPKTESGKVRRAALAE